MEFKYFSRNGAILPIEESVVPLSNIEYQYGFGVYETLRVSNGTVYFMEDHVERLMSSARVIGLEHSFTPETVTECIKELVGANEVGTCNIKILLMGGRTAQDASLSIVCLAPLFPDKKLSRDGVKTITYRYERAFPHAKTLNMLQSYLAYRRAKEAGAYDALLIDREGRITEGTRTNFFCIEGKTIFSPNEDDILLGVTRKAVLHVAANNGYKVQEADIRPGDLGKYDGAFITSTSSKILPIRSIDEYQFKDQPAVLRELMKAFDTFMDTCGGYMG